MGCLWDGRNLPTVCLFLCLFVCFVAFYTRVCLLAQLHTEDNSRERQRKNSIRAKIKKGRFKSLISWKLPTIATPRDFFWGGGGATFYTERGD